MKTMHIICISVYILLSIAYTGLAELPKPSGLRIVSDPQKMKSNFVSQHGITWYFDNEYPIGTFANGDYWVVGPVVITRITPDYDGHNNGWEINPIVEGGQGFSADLPTFDSTLIPKLPDTINPITSVVKTIRSDVKKTNNCRFCLQVAAVLTVVSEPPPPNSFRPPYVGTEKPIFSVNSLRYDLLPSLPLPEYNPAAIKDCYPEIKTLQLDHKPHNLGRELHTVLGFGDNYGAWIGKRNADIALRLMLNDPIKEKMELLVPYIQYGIDLFYMIPLGHTWPDGGGHRPGQKLPLAFAAAMLDDSRMKDTLVNMTNIFHERKYLSVSKVDGRILYGEERHEVDLQKFFEDDYWKVLHSYVKTGYASGNRSRPDPYGYIDGGPCPGTYYQHCCTVQPWKGSVLAVKLMPSLSVIWNDTVTTKYVERWVEQGTWSQPDPCAPADTSWDKYGVTFGPDGDGGCIKDTDSSDGIGRWPNRHNLFIDEGEYYSNLQKALWDKYYK